MKINSKETLVSLISLGLIVPIWGTFHSLIGVNMTWPAFVSASLFFASKCTIKDSKKIAFGHLIGLLWGILFFSSLSYSGFGNYNSSVILYGTLSILVVLAVIITNIGIKLIDHLPSLFSGWAIAVGALDNIPLKQWNDKPFDIFLSMLAGIYIIGVGVSLLQCFLLKIIAYKQSNI